MRHPGAVTLTPREVRALAAEHGVRPTKRWGQNFVVDPNTVRRIARLADVGPGHHVLEIGPGLGSLTLALLETGASVTAVEIDPVLAAALPETLARVAPDHAARLTVREADALRLRPDDLTAPPSAVVANLPYNVAVPVLLELVQRLPSLHTGVVMVQAEVAARLAAEPGNRVYGAPTVKLAWDMTVRWSGQVPRAVFWPVPNVDSALVSLVRHAPLGEPGVRTSAFALVDAAFGQRRKMLRSALAGALGGVGTAEDVLAEAGVDPRLRAEQLDAAAFARVAALLRARGLAT